MGKKILLIVFGDCKELLNDLKKRSIYCFHLENSESRLITQLTDSLLKYINKVIITSDQNQLSEIKKLFPQYQSFFIGSGVRNSILNITDLLVTFDKEQKIPYTNRELLQLRKKDYQYLTMTLILSGLKIDNVSYHAIRNDINNIVNQGVFAETYIVTKVHTVYIGKSTDILTKMVPIDQLIEMDSDDNVDVHQRLNDLKLTRYSNLTSHAKLLYYWKGLYKFYQSSSINTDLVCILDINHLDKIDLDHTIKIVYDNKMAKYETGFCHRDVFFLGTNKISRYYMLLYQYFGSYHFKLQDRYVSTGIFTENEYGSLNKRYTLDSRCQLYEHMLSFTNLIYSHLYPQPWGPSRTKNLILVTYYGIYEQFLLVKTALEKVGFTVYDFPYRHNFDKGGDDLVVSTLTDLINEVNPKYILWWTINISALHLKRVHEYNKRVKHLYFNWDEPYNWDIVDAKHKAKYIDIAYITCQETTKRYLEYGTRQSLCLYPGFSPDIHRPLDLPYQFDITIICTNLYEDKKEYPDQIINRAEIVQSLYDNQKRYNYKFAIFGSESFGERFPDSYQGFCKYEDTCYIFNSSRINLCTHVLGNKSGYLNERVFKILACGGLLLVDPLPGVGEVLQDGINCIFIEPTNYLLQIKRILDNYPHYQKIKENAHITSKKYTWDDWGIRVKEALIN